MSRIIRNSAKALVIRDGKMLAIKLRDADEEWYIMPGGGQEEGEQLSKTVCREIAEEVGIDWLDITTLNTQPLYPSKLRRQIMNYYEGKPYQVYLGNEEVGDPECLE